MRAAMNPSFGRWLKRDRLISARFSTPLGLALLAVSLLLAILLVTRGAGLAALLLALWGALAYAAVLTLETRAGPRTAEMAPKEAVAAPALAADLGLSTRDEVNEQATHQFEALVEEALRGLNEPAKLAKCGLAGRIPRTLAARQPGGDAMGLERGRLLREVLVAAIERLKPAETDESTRALQYYVLNEEYVLGRTITGISVRHSVSEQTVFRRRREAIEALAAELRDRESSLAQGNAARNATAMDYLG